ncbi:glycosyltransferase family A protein [Microbacterium sp. E-13]|uniref:glycosyltransferase family A protein n=1 Tax=Microbacterium sp. E-13 TaxID=3404048 RepID=UPI003CF7AFD6
MTDAPRISVVIPVKDDDTELVRCLRALAAQTRAPDEVIVVDNGSADASAGVARALGARVVRCEAPGIPAASAAGYDAATGDIVLRLDADCVPGDGWVSAMADAFAARPDVAAFTGGAHFVDGPRALRAPLAALYLGAYAAVMTVTLGHLPLFGSNLGMRGDAWRSIRSSVHRDDPRLHDDMDLSFHLGERRRIRYLPRADMGISMRPFANGGSFARRVSRGARTVLIHFPHDFPPVRWNRRLLRAARRIARTNTPRGCFRGVTTSR